ncbi:membrane dipeptidase [Kroppenstedtia pulmonis]|uniref:Membrane dipeptidase n=1 Tax=Kroppenstedtia pulmonis TaxID=1380685 RepID=A0A7D3Y0J9_9BACL|nr:dipeptidase [Kroppenstedtia pulmonis]QKG84520.1 membrane dipeptidase [Kroppenstedtia pulmonis]
MRWIDGHCDVLYKMWQGEHPPSFYEPSGELDVTYPGARSAGLNMQVFAIFVPPELPRSQTWEAALKQVDLFYEQVIQDGQKVVHIQSGNDLSLLKKGGKLGGLLALEGADSLQGDLGHLRLLYRLGVRQVGLTWNYANEAADGIMEERNGGLTRFGRELLTEMKRLQMILDVSHLSVKGFWEVVEDESIPVIASHSNCRSLCSHVRNLDDQQIQALIKRKSLIGITFVPKFVHNDPNQATVDDLFRHIDHICNLGGENCIAFGSDFDGIDEKIPGLEDTEKLDSFRGELLKRYSQSWVDQWTHENWYKFYLTHI